MPLPVRHPIAGIACSVRGRFGGVLREPAAGPARCAAVRHHRGRRRGAGARVGREHRRQLVLHIAGMTVVFLPVIWYVTDRVIEPRLGVSRRQADAPPELVGQTSRSRSMRRRRRGIARAGIAALAVVLLWAWFLFGPGTPLLDQAAHRARLGSRRSSSRWSRASSCCSSPAVGPTACCGGYGQRSHRDIVRMMQESMADLAYYLVLAFAAAHFIAMFAWSNLGLIIAVHGRRTIKRSRSCRCQMLLGLIVLLYRLSVNLFVGFRQSAKWALLAPVLVPMMMMLGVSPGSHHGRLPRRRWRHQHHHAADGVLSR
jgi:aminobenzoyl-glutamate transport protein